MHLYDIIIIGMKDEAKSITYNIAGPHVNAEEKRKARPPSGSCVYI